MLCLSKKDWILGKVFGVRCWCYHKKTIVTSAHLASSSARIDYRFWFVYVYKQLYKILLSVCIEYYYRHKNGMNFLIRCWHWSIIFLFVKTNKSVHIGENIKLFFFFMHHCLHLRFFMKKKIKCWKVHWKWSLKADQIINHILNRLGGSKMSS